MGKRLATTRQRWSLRAPFVISRQTIVEIETVRVALRDEVGRVGRGEAAGLDYAGETALSLVQDVEAVRSEVEAGAGRDDLIRLMPAGGARNALDAALWDLEAKSGAGDPFTRAGVAARPVASTVTLSIGAPHDVEAAARRAAGAAWIKIKVGRDDPLEVVRRVRRAAPRSRLIVDANQAWTAEIVRDLGAELARLRVELLEQPLPVGAEAELGRVRSPIPVCADESCNGVADLPRLAGRFDAINIKLDKVGGLTAALKLADAAQALGLKLMVGCMLAPSLAIAPAMVLAQRCAFVDLDAPPFLTTDSPNGFEFEAGWVERPHDPALWG